MRRRILFAALAVPAIARAQAAPLRVLGTGAVSAPARDLAAVHQFTKDEARLDCLTDPDIIGDQKTGHLQAKRHQQGHELIGPGFEGELRGGPEGTRTAAQCQTHRVREQCRFRLNCCGGVGRQIETGRLDRVNFKRRVEDHRIALAARERAERQNAVLRRRQRDPFAPTGADQISGGKVHRHRDVPPKIEIIASGTPQQVTADPRVLESYLGAGTPH